MENNASKRLSGLFNTAEEAKEAYQYLTDLGIGPAKINVVMSEEMQKQKFPDIEHYTEKGTHAAENAGIGSLIGGTVGAVATIFATIGVSVLIPGLGIFIGGPLAAGLIGGSAGAITGGICGALIGADIPEEQANRLEAGIKQGKIMILVEPENEQQGREIANHWRQLGGEEVHG